MLGMTRRELRLTTAGRAEMRNAVLCMVGVFVVFLLGTNDALARGRIAGYTVKAGANLSTFNDGLNDNALLISPVVGMSLRFDINEDMWLQPELLFSSKGANYHTTLLEEKEDIDGKYINAYTRGTIRLAYIEVPVLVSYAISSGRQRSWSIYGGPAFALRFPVTHDYEGVERVDRPDAESVERTGADANFIRAFDVGLTVGMAVGVPFVRGSECTAEVRITEGLVFIDDFIVDDNSNLRNRVISVLLGFHFAE
jgi:hypothetical protein